MKHLASWLECLCVVFLIAMIEWQTKFFSTILPQNVWQVIGIFFGIMYGVYPLVKELLWGVKKDMEALLK